MTLMGCAIRPRTVFALRLLAWSALAGSFTTTRGAAAADDGAYGRLDGDVALAAEVGAAAGSDGHAAGARVSAAYLTMAGAYAEYDQGLPLGAPQLTRRVSGGVTLRPLFLARFLTGLETGPATFDLWLDSLGLATGTYVAWHDVPGCARACRSEGFELSGEMAVPLLGRAAGPFVALRGGARWAFAADPGAPEGGPLAFVALSIGYQSLVAVGLAEPPP